MADVVFSLRAVDKTRAAFDSVERAIQKQTRDIRQFTFGLAGASGAALLLAREVRHVMENIQDIPGVPRETLESVSRLKSEFAQARDIIHREIAEGIGNISDLIIATRVGWENFWKGPEAAVVLLEKINEEARNFEDSKLADALTQSTEALARANKEFDLVSETDNQRAMRLLREANEEKIRADLMQVETAEQKIAKNKLLLEVIQKRTEANRILHKEVTDAARERERAIQREIEEQKQFNREIGIHLASSFEKAVLEGEKLREVVKGLGRDIAAALLRKHVTSKVIDAATDAKGVGDFFSNLFGGAKALGGPVAAGTPYLVGERGPELFVPNTSGRINSASETSRMGGGGSLVISNTYHIAAGVTRAELLPILEAHDRKLKAEIPDMVRRGGAYRNAFA